ncbi:MAG: sensor domain-containing diguanylate cyclase [Caldimicrobium sp.]
MLNSHTLNDFFKDSEVLLQVLESLGSAIILVNFERKIRYANKKAEELTGYTKNELINENPREFLFVIFSQDLCQFERILEEGHCEFDTLLKRRDGTTFFAHIIATVLKIKENPVGIVLNFIDITEKKELERRLIEASITDYLTGLYNRRFLDQILQREKAMSDRYNIPFSIIILDLDNFKIINDVYGHHTGDKVLVEVAKILKNNLRITDVCGRWGGEEFLIILPNSDMEKALKVAEKLRNLICQLKIPPVESITASFGVSQYKRGEPYEETIKRADLALYKAKGEGKNCVIVF